MNKKIFFSLLLAAFSCEVILSQETDNKLVADLNRGYEQSLDLAERPIAALTQDYIGALRKLREEIQKKGNLEYVLLVENEIKNYAKPGERNFASVPELQRLRRIFDEKILEVTGEVRAKQLVIMKQAAIKFDQLTTDLTRQGDLKSALRSRDLRAEILVDIEKISEGKHDFKEPEEDEFNRWVEQITFLAVSSGTKFEYRDGEVKVIRASGLNEQNKAKIGSDHKIEFKAKAGPAFIQVSPDRVSASYFLNSRLEALLRVIDPNLEK